MNITIKNKCLLVLLLWFPLLAFSQTLQLGTLSTFGGYTGSGACVNSGTFTGDIGTNDGAITGFVPPSYTGTVHNNNETTLEAKVDIMRLYIHINDIFVDYPSTHAAAFGAGETISPGVYSIAGAGSLGGSITLDGGGNPDAVFIIKFLGAMSIGAGSTTVLANGTRAANVYWIAEGAISAGAGSILKGTLFSHGGAISLAANCDLEGRMLSTEGKLTVGIDSEVRPASGFNTISVPCKKTSIPAAAVNVFGSVADFTLFTGAGAITNTATSGTIGKIGSNAGAISGFGSSTNVGSSHTADGTTAQAKVDLDNAYNQLMLSTNTVTNHAPAFGNGETLTKGVYFIAGAGSLTGTITLDAQADPNAIFVFKFAGAFSVAALSKVIFANGTHRNNVIWISGAGVATGATTIGTLCVMKGTFLAHGGACNIGAGGFVEGRMLSTSGAVGFSSGVIFNDPLCYSAATPSSLPIELLRFTAEAKDSYLQLDWVTLTEINNDYFTVERSSDGINFSSIFEINGAGNSSHINNYSTIDDSPLEGWSYYRLKQTDYDGKTSYSNIVTEKFNGLSDFSLEIYPNPFPVKTVFRTNRDFKDTKLIVYNSYGRAVKEIQNISGQTFTFYRENLSSGLYFVNLIQDSNLIVTEKFIITE